MDAAVCARLTADAHDVLEHHAGTLEERRRTGFVRHCHGDLHLRNVCLIQGVPTLFDGVEFNDDISCVDVFYDLAFLLMDLWRRDLRQHANLVFNEYLTRTADLGALPVLPLFLSCRAAIRAKTSVSAAAVHSDVTQRTTLEMAGRQYLALAEAFLRTVPPRLIAIGGFSGVGKSTLGKALAPNLGSAPGALLLRSDVIRKTLLGVPELTRLGADGYTADVTRRVYDTARAQARTALAAGQSVIADAVYASTEERAAIAGIARDAGVPFVGFWLEAEPSVLAERLGRRHHDASDATLDVLETQLQSGAGIPSGTVSMPPPLPNGFDSRWSVR